MSAKEYYADLSHPEFLASLSLAIVTLIVGDCVMVRPSPFHARRHSTSSPRLQIYRLRTVFNYNRSTAVFPICCLFGFLGELGASFLFPSHHTRSL